ncbi:MAG: methyltransferase domain-containing protein [Treponemataceae bacterium]|nr:methyltransferase domain-containing protein [Treponemataceae bacterium]
MMIKKAVVVQCRLGSTRLKNKALKKIDEKTILEYVLNSMKNVDACLYYVLTDFASAEKLKPIVEKCGWNLFAGSEFDVLDRFCSFVRFIENTEIQNFPDIIVRATADNPFLFYDCASKMIDSYEEKVKYGLLRDKNFKIDYFTWTGLPHGSGVEILKTLSLLESVNYTSSPYDHEHVGPALYNHKDRYNCVFEPAPEMWNYPELRTTVDTFQDFFRAKTIINYVKLQNNLSVLEKPLDSQVVIDACNSKSVKYPILFVPNIDGSHGSGHLKRCLELASLLCADIYFPKTKNSRNYEILETIVNGYILQGLITSDQIVKDEFPKDFYSLIVLDNFKTNKTEINYFSEFGNVISIDEGSNEKILQKISYSLNIIPSAIKEKNINFSNYDYIPLPKNQKESSVKSIKDIKNVIIVFGGMDKSLFALKLAQKIENILLSEKNSDFTITIVTSNKLILESEFSSKICAKSSIANLKDKFCEYDLVFTHYGFSAFEAVSSNCLVFTFAPSSLHKKLSKKMGLTNLSHGISESNLKVEIENLIQKKDSEFISKLKKNNFEKLDSNKELSLCIRDLSEKKLMHCPICNLKNQIYNDKIISRDKIKTIRRCKVCNLDYISFENVEKTVYNANYFGQEYKNQYGKTYLEDFNSIKENSLRRHQIVDKIFRKTQKDLSKKGKVLDIGCAYGPYLSASSDLGWLPFGIEPSSDAVDYVKNKLNFNAICSKFPVENLPTEFSNFNAVTMWYVIEHFENLDEVLSISSSLLDKKGIFAFATPSNSGVSGKYNTESFYKQSPSDHFSIWNPKIAKKILKKYGFKTVKVVSTGIHPERYPFVKKHNVQKGTFVFKLFELHSKLFSLGDTFEIYAIKK